MIQDISPSRLINAYMDIQPEDKDSIFCFDSKGDVLLGRDNGRIVFPDSSVIKSRRMVYLFAIDDRRFFLAPGDTEDEPEGFSFYPIHEVRDSFADDSQVEVYGVFTAYHLWRWYSDNVFCGRCAKKLTPGTKERSLVCLDCGNTVYPRINPAVIVGVTNGDRILLTRYRHGYKHNALVAGFTEIGETLEETVRREVKEEAGLEVKNIRYYKSQPWGMAQDILAGFYCDVDGSDEIHMDDNELRYAQWVKREDIILQPNNLSLTNEMMKRFRDGAEDLHEFEF